MALLSQPVEDWRERPDPSDGRASRRQGDSPDPLRVMIVEDDFLVAMTIEQAIRGAGMEVVGIAPTRKKALALCQAERPDFATMDINLRGDQVGIQVALEIAERFDVRSLFISAYTGDKARMAAADPANPFGWVDKPFTTHHLMSRLTRVADSLRDRSGDH
tara:strand:- start:1820 stop:2302 length:483 start_codon:yes stop_codon:yes gene_type:complete